MTKQKVSTKDWRALPLEKWNVTTFHAYLIDRNQELYGADYVPFGRGSISQRWSTEKGQLKQAINAHGQAVVKGFIDLCFETHRFNPKFPVLSFGFMWAYLRDNVARAQQAAQKQQAAAASVEAVQTIEKEWF